MSYSRVSSNFWKDSVFFIPLTFLNLATLILTISCRIFKFRKLCHPKLSNYIKFKSLRSSRRGNEFSLSRKKRHGALSLVLGPSVDLRCFSRRSRDRRSLRNYTWTSLVIKGGWTCWLTTCGENLTTVTSARQNWRRSSKSWKIWKASRDNYQRLVVDRS